jgi:hypothetical protein
MPDDLHFERPDRFARVLDFVNNSRRRQGQHDDNQGGHNRPR